MIPRNEITQIGHNIEQAIRKRRRNIMLFLAGSYPSSLKKESKDIDILLVHTGNKSSSLTELVKLINAVIPLETITIGDNKFLGIVKQDKVHEHKWRHLDMRIVNMTEFPFAWMYYSSGKIFNKLIRERIKKKGYKLNECGVYQDTKRIVLEEEQNLDTLEKEIKKKEDLLEYSTKVEKEIFKLAGMQYQTIRERY